jgi:hypothetical protein
MGEYAIRNSDGVEIKIGTCECMYYLRYEDRGKITHKPGNVDPANERGLFFRPPFPDENEIMPGEYDDYNRTERLYKSNGDGQSEPLTFDGLKPGTIQLSHKCGLLLNVKCYHGAKLPEGSPEIKPFWNGKDPFALGLRHIKLHEDGKLYPVIACRFCGEMWRCEWPEVWEYIRPIGLREACEQYKHL